MYSKVRKATAVVYENETIIEADLLNHVQCKNLSLN